MSAINRQYEVTPDTKVLLNEEPADLNSLKAGDQIEITKDENGKEVINGSRCQSGFIIGLDQQNVLVTTDYLDKTAYQLTPNSSISINEQSGSALGLRKGDPIVIKANSAKQIISIDVVRTNLGQEFLTNFKKNLFKPLLLFFYRGFCVLQHHILLCRQFSVLLFPKLAQPCRWLLHWG